MGKHLAGLEGQGILCISRPLSTLAQSNIFSLQGIVLATVPSGSHLQKRLETRPRQLAHRVDQYTHYITLTASGG